MDFGELRKRAKDGQAFDPPTVLALLDEVERLRGDVRQWMCDHCDVVYPGPPADGVWCVVCSRCGGDTAPRTVVERWRLQRELDRLSAENARLISDIKMITAPVEVGGGADAYLRAEIERLRREREMLVSLLRQVDVVMDGAAMMGVGSIMTPRYREDWAVVHTRVREHLALLDGGKGGGADE